MRNHTNITFTPCPSSASTCNTDEEDILIRYDIDDSPFDEPPLSKRCSFSEIMDGATQDKYRLDGYPFFQSSIQAQDGHTDEYNSKMIVNAVQKRLDTRKSSMCSSRIFDGDDGSSVCGSRSEYSDDSSFMGTLVIEKESNEEFDKRNRCNLGGCCTMVGDFNTFLCLPISSFRSKPLPKPVIWKEYTCLQSACVDASAAIPCEDNLEDISFCKRGSREKTRVQTEPCHEVLSLDNSTIIMQDASNANYCFKVESLQRYLEFAKTSVDHFLKRRIFVDDPEINTSKEDVNDYDSMADSTIFSFVSATTE